MIITKPTQDEAQELADRCHAYLLANDPAYTASVEAGHTLQWAIPTQDEESGLWQVPVNERVYPCLTKDEYVPPAADHL